MVSRITPVSFSSHGPWNGHPHLRDLRETWAKIIGTSETIIDVHLTGNFFV